MCTRRRAFSVIELLVVISIVALLVAILIPSLAGVQEKSLQTGSRTNLRTHAQVFAAYATEFEDRFPFLTEASEETTHYEAGGYDDDMSVFTQYAVWPIALAGRYYDGRVKSPTFHPPASELSGPITEYWYSQSFVADPSFWIPERRQYIPEQLRATATHEVLFPSAKGLFFERDQAFGFFETGSGAINIALVDGSVRMPRGEEFTRPYPGGCRGYLLGPIIGFPVMHTIEGVRGRDLAP